MANKVFGLRLDLREEWAWQRLGNQQIRMMIAPPEIGVECTANKAQPGRRNGWFCFPCQDKLDQGNLLPEPEHSELQRQNRQLRAEISKLRTHLAPQHQGTETHQEQLTLFS